MTENGLKGRHILAKGETIRQLTESVALGLRARIEIDRDVAWIKK